MPVSVVQLASQLPQKMQVSYRWVILLTGGSASRSSTMLKHSGVGQAFTHAPQPMQVSRSNSGLPLYFSGTTHGLAGNRVVKRGDKTAVIASFNSLSFGKRNFKLLHLVVSFSECYSPNTIRFSCRFLLRICQQRYSPTVLRRKHKNPWQLHVRPWVRLSI